MKGTLETFVKTFQDRYPESELDFGQAVYVDSKVKIKVIDHELDDNGNEYGEFWISPSNLLKGETHPKKRRNRISMAQRSKQDEVIKRFNEVHKGENLDYSQVEYVNMHTKVKIICHELDENGEEYGEFWQEPVVHLKGCSHPRLGKEKSDKAKTSDTETFIKKCKELYGEKKYNYDNVNYINNRIKVAVFCNKCTDGKPHGIFYTIPGLFLRGKGCPICGHQLSKNENELYDYVCELVGKDNVIHNDTSILNGKEIDIYIPNKQLAIEYNGLRWHSEKFRKDKNYHLQKTEACEKLGITLFQVFEDEYLNHKDLVNDRIKKYLNINDGIKIDAANCSIKEIDKETCESFLNLYSLEEFMPSSIYIGAYYNEYLIAVMMFRREKENVYRLNECASNINYDCANVIEKIFTHFVNSYDPDEIKTFLDRRWFNAIKENLFNNLGFKQMSITKPDFTYTQGQGKRYRKLKNGNSPLQYNFEKIWDCGLIKCIWKKEKAQEIS